MSIEDNLIYARLDSGIPLLEVREKVKTSLGLNDRKEPCFFIQKLQTTDAFDKEEHNWKPQSITCIVDPLGIHGETLIGQRRTERPKSEARHVPSTGFDENTIMTLFPILIKRENLWLLSTIIEDIDNSKSLGWLYWQLDLIKDNPVIHDLQKKILLNPAVPSNILFKKCIFCILEGEKIKDTTGENKGAISINNDYPFGPLIHKVLILQTKEHDISEISAEHISRFYELLVIITERAKKQLESDLDGITYGMNYGLPRVYKGQQVIAAGASQLHIHTQVTGIGKNSYHAGDTIGALCKAYKNEHDRDYLGDYMEALKNFSLIIDEDEHALLYVPIAQRFNYELQIMIKEPNIGNILQTSVAIRQSIARLEYLAYSIYQHHDININSFNTVMHSTRFSAHNDYNQRMIISIYPRTTIVAFSELAGRYVVDSFPWEVAAKMQGIKESLLHKGIKKLVVLIIGAHPDDIELGCGGTIRELINRNHEIYALIVTDGCAGVDRIPAVREKEANEAANVLGVNVSFGRIRDSQAIVGDALYTLIEHHIKLRKPDLIITHANIQDHTDHKNISDVVRTLCSRHTPKIYPLLFEVPAPAYKVAQSFRPNICVNIEQSKEEKKAAIMMHQSEIARKTINLEEVEKRALMRGSELDSAPYWAEAFMYDAPSQELPKLLKLIPFVKTRVNIE